MKDIYYVVEKETHLVDDNEFLSGSKQIRVYYNENGRIVLKFIINSDIQDNPEMDVISYLEHNGYFTDPNEYNLIEL